jgi:hypothetical protein
VARDTLRLLSVGLEIAYQMHRTGHPFQGRDPWQLVREVQERLVELSQAPAGGRPGRSAPPAEAA